MAQLLEISCGSTYTRLEKKSRQLDKNIDLLYSWEFVTEPQKLRVGRTKAT